MSWQDREKPDESKPFLEHLEDLRRAILWSLAFLAVGILIAIPLAPLVLYLVKVPLVRAGVDPAQFLRVLRVAGGFSTAMQVIFWTGLIISAPFIVFAVGNFVAPGLTVRERRTIGHAAGFAVVLFVAGVALGYFSTLPVAVRMMLGINKWMGISCEFVELGDYVSFVLGILLAFGLAFELPMIVVILGSLGIVSSKQLREKRRHVIVGIFIIAAILTPPDAMTQIMMAVPLVLLNELCIWLVWFRERKRAE
jgi:sec-independent protein translocase protein TatC